MDPISARISMMPAGGEGALPAGTLALGEGQILGGEAGQVGAVDAEQSRNLGHREAAGDA